MKDLKEMYWEHFEKTGSIQAYLNYKTCGGEEGGATSDRGDNNETG